MAVQIFDFDEVMIVYLFIRLSYNLSARYEYRYILYVIVLFQMPTVAKNAQKVTPLQPLPGEYSPIQLGHSVHNQNIYMKFGSIISITSCTSR